MEYAYYRDASPLLPASLNPAINAKFSDVVARTLLFSACTLTQLLLLLAWHKQEYDFCNNTCYKRWGSPHMQCNMHLLVILWLTEDAGGVTSTSWCGWTRVTWEVLLLQLSHLHLQFRLQVSSTCIEEYHYHTLTEQHVCTVWLTDWRYRVTSVARLTKTLLVMAEDTVQLWDGLESSGDR